MFLFGKKEKKSADGGNNRSKVGQINSKVTIEVLGSGCITCQKLYGDVKKAAAEVCTGAEVLHITDIRILAECGISATPAVFINGKVVSMGKVLSDAQIKQLILSSVSGS